MTTSTRIWRLSGMRYFEDDLQSGLEIATDETLRQVHEAGMTGILATLRLRDVARTSVFDSFGSDAPVRQELMRSLVERCRAHDLKLYIYLNEPRGFPADDRFWSRHPEVRGAAGESVMDDWDRSCAMCTSRPETLSFLEEACADMFASVPGLGGVVCICASEHHTHCYSHFDLREIGLGDHWGHVPGEPLDCPRCRSRRPREVVAEVMNAIRGGVHRAAPEAEVIAWTWSWDIYEPPPQRDMIAALHPSIIVMSDLERGGELQYEGVVLPVDEYSLAYVGPSSRCRGQIEAARDSGHCAMARFQVNNTVEMATAPSLPLVDHLFRKLAALAELGVTSIMASWNFGGRLDTLNVFAARMFMEDPTQRDPKRFLGRLAETYFDVPDGREIAAAWESLGDAMRAYPFSVSFLYFGPFNCALVFPLLNHEPRERSMKIWNFDKDGFGDRLEESLPPLDLAGMIGRLRVLYDDWTAATAGYAQALSAAGHVQRATVERNVAAYVAHLVHSSWVIYCWLAWRYHRGDVPTIDGARIRQCLEAEIENLDQAARLVASDSRLGYYEENTTYYITEARIREKIAGVTGLLVNPDVAGG